MNKIIEVIDGLVDYANQERHPYPGDDVFRSGFWKGYWRGYGKGLKDLKDKITKVEIGNLT